MKYQTYPAYKDSGVEWLGDVPEHWVLCSLIRQQKTGQKS
jgi:type I restriction enzyme S subunit